MGAEGIVVIEDANKTRHFYVSSVEKVAYTVDYTYRIIYKAATIEVKYTDERKGEVPEEKQIEIRDAVEKHIKEEAKQKDENEEV